jgi:hypothetical protein
VVERSATQAEIRWPGQVLAVNELNYLEAMQKYAEMTRDRLTRGKIDPKMPEKEPTEWRKGWEARAERHQVLEKRRREDAHWRDERKTHHEIVVQYRAKTRRQRTAAANEWEKEKELWRQKESERNILLCKRKQENDEWHQRNRMLRGEVTTREWMSILVITDNCTRQCLALPLFVSGAKVTAQEVVSALQPCLPDHLKFVISDQGLHFRNKILAALATKAGFTQILIYRHRPQTNGIAERFVRTLKSWLAPKFWLNADELSALLSEFRTEYNERPHQGLAIPGLSPDEFSKRLWLM